jgi:membrane protein DedA with SNARE-associated domain
MRHYLDKYGIFAFIVCRFIPFGFRKPFFFASGFFAVDFRVFALFDLAAAFISTNTIFFLTYFLGESAKKPLVFAALVFSIFAATMLISLLIRFALNRGKKSA